MPLLKTYLYLAIFAFAAPDLRAHARFTDPQALINALIGLGFTDPKKVISERKSLLNISVEHGILAHFKALNQLGMQDVVKMATREPIVLDPITLPKIKNFVRAFSKLGFTNPIAMIEDCPGLLEFSVKAMVKMAKELLGVWKLTPEEIGQTPKLLSVTHARTSALIDELIRLEIDPAGLPLSLKKRLVRTLSVSDIRSNLNAYRLYDLNEQRRACRSVRILPLILRLERTCTTDLRQSPLRILN